MADIIGRPVLMASSEVRGMMRRASDLHYAIGGAVEGHRGDCDRRLGRQSKLDLLQRRTAFDKTEAVPIGMYDDVDEIGIVESRGGAVVSIIAKSPSPRPQPPKQLAESAAIFLQPGAPSLAMKIILIPEAMLIFGRSRGRTAGRCANAIFPISFQLLLTVGVISSSRPTASDTEGARLKLGLGGNGEAFRDENFRRYSLGSILSWIS